MFEITLLNIKLSWKGIFPLKAKKCGSAKSQNEGIDQYFVDIKYHIPSSPPSSLSLPLVTQAASTL